ncbi:MAG: PhzF family phenazine biosynthesis protein [Elainellaceae cyanobacterium]
MESFAMQISQVDAFTARPFAGNPAAVCILTSPRPEAWMQQVAQEMNLSETAFLIRQGDRFSLRWFTPQTEVDLCGHATLAGAHVLWTEGHLPPAEVAQFETRSGLLTARQVDGWIELDFPATPIFETAAPEGLAEALGAEIIFAGKSRFDYLIELPSEAAVRQLQPDFVKLRSLPVRGVIVTSLTESSLEPSADAGYDFISRFFAPGSGIDEDPVTGSAHCALGPFWQDRLGKDVLSAYQASPRGGEIQVYCRGDRVGLRGQAVTILKGKLVN